MSGEIAEFVQTCKGCQLRKPEKIGDRAPITPIVRPELPFEIVNIDVIGPIQPPSGRGHKYVLCMMDQHTRWPEALPLRSLTAKNACDSLLQIFSRTGIPSVIASDQGTNFKSALTQEFTKMIGSSPRFSCPGYPASNGLVERWNKVLKDMIHHVIREDPRSWDRQLPFLLFAYREVPNTTTGVSSFRLLYGREARGPLAILKSSWAGEIHLPTNISQSAADYLQEMKINMEKAAESASLTAAQKQKAYGDYFNKRSSVKNFSIGEQVVLLIPDSSNKIYARWTGPGEIIQHHPPHSYKVKLSDGTVRHVHVNKIRKYHPRALAVGVIFEGDHEFGEIHPTPNLSRSTSERVLHEINLNHLKESEREQVLAIVLKHQTLFTSDVKIAKVGTHRIRLKPNIERKKPFVYRIPESLKIKVDEQIEELVRLDLIEESDAEIAYPIVCVNKKDGTLRLCVDSRALNSESVSDDFPMEDAVELIHSIEEPISSQR
ncbi:retrovirus-related Pol polyprotein from transposon 412 [Trichonephila clavipes]|nr:retrovirus-related Pol polyprotein from transposon 412 [Trichonephila clavipes]